MSDNWEKDIAFKINDALNEKSYHMQGLTYQEVLAIGIREGAEFRKQWAEKHSPKFNIIDDDKCFMTTVDRHGAVLTTESLKEAKRTMDVNFIIKNRLDKYITNIFDNLENKTKQKLQIAIEALEYYAGEELVAKGALEKIK